ncbi:hypothetical protein PR048_016339 [Dryococelus australis]|uniref:Transmembrane protein n=1 Tax=Dryococelus australis TaxID=614101 RepID=A0ABQ9HJR9_9NEOP|nr:hypothetical protein PR048_016339 [Dryococelus australis]
MEEIAERCRFTLGGSYLPKLLLCGLLPARTYRTVLRTEKVFLLVVCKTSAGNAVQAQQGQGMAALLVMMAVLFFIVGYCCWGAPCCRAFCRRRCCCCHSMAGDLEASPSDIGLSVDRGMVATPTIILLPYGRMLVVDGSVFAQLQADTNGLDLIELGENVVRAQQRAIPPPTPSVTTGSVPSILEVDSETNSKGCISPVQESFPPPAYDTIFGGENVADLPPSYSEILRQLQSFGSAENENENENETIEPTDNGPPAIEGYQPGEIRESRV